ncbi:hypothetical protein C3L33_22563, partial [Rhododendron williamsianum]
MENPAADQLPEAHSLPDGFVDSSPEPLAPSTLTLEQEKPVIDYKEEKLVEADSRHELVLNELQPSEGKTEKSENSRTFPVLLSENDGCDESPTPEQENSLSDYKEERLVEIDSRPELVVNELQSSEEKAEKSENSRTFPVPLTENDDVCDGSQGLELLGKGSSSQSECISVMAELAKPVSGAQEQCLSSKKVIEGGIGAQAAQMKEVSSADSAENNRKIVSIYQSS